MISEATFMLKDPLRSIAFLYSFTIRILLILAFRILLPTHPRYQTLRIELHRAYLTSATLHFPDLPHRLPAIYPTCMASPVSGTGWSGFLVPGFPGNADDALEHISETAQDSRNRIVLFAHGGGYARGTATMYVPYMHRWVSQAKYRGLLLMFLSVEYTLSLHAAHPKQRDEFLAAYNHLLALGIPPSRIVFMGDSAGGGLCVNSSLHLLRQSLLQPRATVLISPWMDLEMTALQGGSSAVTSDYFVQANQAIPGLVKLFCGDHDPADPTINPLRASHTGLTGLNPQLILVGAAEFALWDAKAWAAICSKAKAKHKLHIEWAQLHVWALGSAWIRPALRRRTDKCILDWIYNPGVGT